MTNPLTTAEAPPAGIYWQAVIYASFELSLTPTITIAEQPTSLFNLNLTPVIQMLGPQAVQLILSPTIAMLGGTFGTRSFALDLTPAVTMAGGEAFNVAANIALTPSFSMAGTAVTPPAKSVTISLTPTMTMAATKTVTYDAAGVGGTGTNPSWSHTISGNCVLIWACNATGAPTSVTVGTSTASLVNSWPDGSGTILYLYKLLSPPTGAQTVTVNGSSQTAASSVSYNNATTVGTPTSTTGGTTSTTVSISIASSVAQTRYVMGSTYTSSAGATYSGFNQSQRYLISHVGTTNQPLLIGDAAGNGGSLTFSATRSQTGFNWVAAAVPLS